MIKRISLTFIVMAALCTAAFTLGGAKASGQADTSGIPPQHPTQLALKFRQQLGLSAEQATQLEQMRGALAKELAPFKEQADAIQHKMEDLKQSGNPDPEVAKKLQQSSEDLGSKIKPLFDHYADMVAQLLSPEQREKLMKIAAEQSQDTESRNFVMMFVMSSREQLGISPQQFTKLQYLQADFIRAFAPIREQMELLQMEIRQKSADAGTDAGPAYKQRGEALETKVRELQASFSERAVHEVLLPEQRTKLEEILGGQHRPATNGG